MEAERVSRGSSRDSSSVPGGLQLLGRAGLVDKEQGRGL